MAIAYAVTAVSALTTASLVAAILPADGQSGRDFRANATALQVAAGTGNVSAYLPSPAAAPIAVTAVDNASPWYGQVVGGQNDNQAAYPVVGSYKLHLVPVVGDPNGSSVLQYLLPPGALVVTATG
jgi:hypothetical protein